MYKVYVFISLMICISIFQNNLIAQSTAVSVKSLHVKDRSIISIASLAAKGDTGQLKPALYSGLESGLTVNEIKEVLVHLYAYCGFPRSIRGLQTFMEVLNERKAKGIHENIGKNASIIKDSTHKYERGKKILSELTKIPQPEKPTGYADFAPVIDRFIKEHLFADIFERDILTYSQREWVTISVIATIGNAEPMLQNHYGISLNVGITAEQLKEFVLIIKSIAGKKEAKAAQIILDKVLQSQSSK